MKSFQCFQGPQNLKSARLCMDRRFENTSFAAPKSPRRGEQIVIKTTFVKLVVLCGFVLATTVSLDTVGRLGAKGRSLGYSELSNGRGGTNAEAVAYTAEMGFDKKRSLKAFKDTLYPLLRPRRSAERGVARGDYLPPLAQVAGRLPRVNMETDRRHATLKLRIPCRSPRNPK